MTHHSNTSLAAAGVIFGLVTAAQAADAPLRKAGQWEVKTSIDGRGHPVAVRQCIDAATDQMLQSSTGPFAGSACPEREVKKSDTGLTIDSRCTFNGKPASVHVVVSGSFEDAYTMTVTSEGSDLPAAKMTMEGKWIGACAADQKPGDVVMANGVKVNIPELQRRAVGPDTTMPMGK